MGDKNNLMSHGGAAGRLGGGSCRGGGLTGGRGGPTASTESNLTPGVQPGQGDLNTEQVPDVNKTVEMETDEKEKNSRERIKGKRSFPQSTNDRRFLKNQRKHGQKPKYEIPEDPFMAAVDREYMKKKTFSDCVRDKDNIILEVRCEDLNVALEKEDFKFVNSQLLFKYLECKQSKLEELDLSEDEEIEEEEGIVKDSFFYGVIGGISNGGLWLACDNETTAEFVKYHVPLLTFKDNRKYKVYTSDARPFRYMKARIPIEFWSERRTVEYAFVASNKCLHTRIKDASGKKVKPHFKICFGCENFDDDLDEEDKNYYWVQFSIDERLMNKLADLKGRLNLGADRIQLLGGGMVTKAKEVIAENMRAATTTNVVTNESG